MQKFFVTLNPVLYNPLNLIIWYQSKKKVLNIKRKKYE